jgi:allantoin racemase
MESCLDIVIAATHHEIECVELPGAPPGIETDADVALAIPHLLTAVAEQGADAYVVSCFSDPGLQRVRAATSRPVVGIAEAAYLAALGLGSKFGIVSMGPSSIVRHRTYLEKLGLIARLAGDRSIDMTIPQLMSTNVVETVARVGRELRDRDGADVIILGCAGLGSYRSEMEAVFGLPVVDPVQAGVVLACNTLDLRYMRGV